MGPLFVYGTLMAGEANAAELGGATFLGAARTAARYTLYDLGPFPGLVAEGSTAIAGELYDLPPDRLPALDAFEEHPEVYRRAPIALADGRAAVAYLLVSPPASPSSPFPVARAIAGGDWRQR
jgi:gamma-glutamylaminecyclotransferase